MERLEIESELKNIFKLMKASTDKDLLTKICEEKGLIVQSSILKESSDLEKNFEESFSNLLKISSSQKLLLDTVKAYDKKFRNIISKQVRPKSDPTFDEVEKKDQKNIKKILKDDKGQKGLSGVVKVWNKAFMLTMEQRYGKWDPKQKSFVNEEGQALVSLKGSDGEGIRSIQDYVYATLERKIQGMPKGWTVEDLSDGILTYMFYPSAIESSSESVYDAIDRSLENGKAEGKLPVTVGGLIKKIFHNRAHNFIKSVVNQQFADEVLYDDVKEYIKELQERFNKEKNEEKKLKLKNKIERKQEELKTLENALKKHQDPSEWDSGSVQRHKFVEMDFTPEGDREFEFSPEKVEMIADTKELIEDLIIRKNLEEDFGKFVKKKGDDLTYRVYQVVMMDDSLDLTKKDDIRKMLEIADKSKLELSSFKLDTVSGKLKNLLAEYAYEKDDSDLLSAMDKMNILPKKYKIKKSSNLGIEEFEKLVSYFEKIYS